jgi:hypothetical protein
MLTNVYDTVRGEIQLVNGDWYVTKVVILSRSGKTRPQIHMHYLHKASIASRMERI